MADASVSQKHTRTFAKAVTWRVLATGATIVIVFIFTRDLVISMEVGGVEVAAKFILYYLHERVWNRIGWGFKKKGDVQ